MRLLDHSLPSAEENLALEEALLEEAEAGRWGEQLRLWSQPSVAVVLGVSGQVADEVHLPACQVDGVPVLRRPSGGGTVLLGPGCLCFSLLLDLEARPHLRAVGQSNRFILGTLAAGLAAAGLTVELLGSSDLAIAGRKFSGNAQRRGRRFLLHHGTLLHAFPLEAIGRYLKEPPRQPEYRQRRVHDRFVRNLPLDEETLRRTLASTWQATPASAPLPLDRVRQLVEQRYSRQEWNLRR